VGVASSAINRRTVSSQTLTEETLKILFNFLSMSPIAGGAETLVADVVVPQTWSPYVVERTSQLTAFWQSGVVQTDPAFDILASGGGQTTPMPYWQDLQGSDEVLSDTGSLSTGKITASSDSAVLHNRGKAWSTNDLAGVLAGSDPARQIAELVADYRARRLQDMLIAELKGVFGTGAAPNTTMTANMKDIHATTGMPGTANFLTGSTYIDARQLLGDAQGKLVAIAMHSATHAALLKQDLIDFIPVTDARRVITQFQGLDVIVDDSMPQGVENGTTSPTAYYTSYLFGLGAIALGTSAADYPIEGGAPGSTWQVEFARVALAGQNIMINRWRIILHPRGVKWTGSSMLGLSPQNAELSIIANWARVYEAKNVRMVQITHNNQL
jgi:hypothetical protein